MTTSTGTPSPETLERARNAAEMRLLGLHLERPTPERRTEIRSLLPEIHDSELKSIAEAFVALDEPSYVALLGPGGPVSPREVSYRRREDPGGIMADVSTFYDAFGYRPRAEDPVDHVAVETGFVAFLYLKEAYLLDQGADADVVAKARDGFVADHLSILASGLAAKLREFKAPELRSAAEALAARTGSLPAPAPDGLAEDDSEMTCGGCGTPPA